MDFYSKVDVFFMFVVDHFDKGVKVLLDGANVKRLLAIGRITRLPRANSYHGKPIF
jgi:hypothetical protein